MAVAYGSRSPRSSGLYEVLDLILDKGLVIDAYVRVSLVGIEILTIDARIVVASVDTYLRFAEAVNRLELGGGESSQSRGLPEVIGRMQEGGARSKTQGALSGARESVSGALGGGDREDDGRSSHRREPGLLSRAAESVKGAFDGDEQDEEGEEPDGGRDEDAGAPRRERAMDREAGDEEAEPEPRHSRDRDEETVEARRAPRGRQARGRQGARR